MGRQPCCDKLGVKKGPWTADEDKKLINFIVTNGQCCWRAVPKLAGLRRCGKSCRLRWTNYLRPDLKRGLLNDAEEKLVIELHARLGNRWSKIASKLPGRTDNEIKNHWNTHIKKKLLKMGIDPVTHQPLNTQQNTNETENSSRSTASNNLPEPEKGNQIQLNATTMSEENSDQNSLSDGQSNLYENDPLISCLFMDDPDQPPQVEVPWEFPLMEEINLDDFCATSSWDECCSWLLDCHDFGVTDFGFDVDMNINDLTSLETGNNIQ